MILAVLALIAGILHSQGYDPGSYQWCMANLQSGSDYCCGYAGGVFVNGACGDAVPLPPPPPLPHYNGGWP